MGPWREKARLFRDVHRRHSASVLRTAIGIAAMHQAAVKENRAAALQFDRNKPGRIHPAALKHPTLNGIRTMRQVGCMAAGEYEQTAVLHSSVVNRHPEVNCIR